MPPNPQITTFASRRVVKPCALSSGCRPPISGAHRCPIWARTATCRCRAAASVRASACSATVRSCSERPLVITTSAGKPACRRDPRPGREVLHPAQLGQAPGRVGERAGRVGPRDEHLRVDVLLGHRLGDPVPDRVELGVGIAQLGEVERDRVGHEDLHGGSCTGGVIVILEASRPDVELNIGRARCRRRARTSPTRSSPTTSGSASSSCASTTPRPRALRTPTPCARCGTRWPRSSTCTPSPRRRSSTRSCCGAATEDPEEATLDAIGDHNDIRDGVHAAETHTVGTRGVVGGRRGGPRGQRRAHGRGGARGHRRLPRQRPGGPARGARPPVRARSSSSTRRPTG